MGGCLAKHPIDVSVDNTSSCPSPCCDNDSCSLYCCVVFRKGTPATAMRNIQPAKNEVYIASVAGSADSTKPQIDPQK